MPPLAITITIAMNLTWLINTIEIVDLLVLLIWLAALRRQGDDTPHQSHS